MKQYYGQEKLKTKLKNYNNVIYSFLKKYHPNSAFYVMTGSIKDEQGNVIDETLKRYKHCGAHLLVNDLKPNGDTKMSTYYYITFSKKDQYEEDMVSLNKHLFELIKKSNDNYKVLCIAAGYIAEFLKEDIIENAEDFSSCVKVAYKYARTLYKYSNEDFKVKTYPLDWSKLSLVRYDPDHIKHHQPINLKICFDKYKGSQNKYFKSIIEAYKWLSSEDWLKTYKYKMYTKSYKQFRRDIKANKLSLVNPETGSKLEVPTSCLDAKTSKSTVDSVIQPVGQPEGMSTSILFDNIYKNNIDMDTSKEVSSKIDNNPKTDFDKMLARIKKMDSDDGFYTRSEILDMAKYCDNDNMFTVMYNSLFEKGFQAEAETLRKIYNATK